MSLEYQQYLKDNMIIDDGCWIWQGTLSYNGYARARRLNGCQWAHRNSYIVFKGPVTKEVVMHSCNIRCCINPEHLIDGTYTDNMLDCVSKGNWTPRITGPKTRFDEETCKEILNVYNLNRFTGREIAAGFDISERQVMRIIERERDKHE